MDERATSRLKAEITEHILLQNNLLPLSLNLDKVYEIEDHSDILTNDKIESIAQNIAYQKLLNTLAKDSKILSQKKLKLNIKNSTIETINKTSPDLLTNLP